jgi:hypothetical protein
MIEYRVEEAIVNEMERQNDRWGTQDPIPDDRWMEIATDEFNDLRWSVRTCGEVDNHTIDKEMTQLIAVLIRWQEARANR